jgi:hypothetical protein
MSEEWRGIQGWPEYEVSEFGRVRRVSGACGATVGRLLKPNKMKKSGYLLVCLSRHPLRKFFLVHRLVAVSFIGEIPADKEVCHDDGNKENCHKSNLRIDTRKGNMADQIRHGKTPRGERSGSNKYDTALIVGIRCALEVGFTVSALASGLGIPRPTLYGIRSKQTWGWL